MFRLSRAPARLRVDHIPSVPASYKRFAPLSRRMPPQATLSPKCGFAWLILGNSSASVGPWWGNSLLVCRRALPCCTALDAGAVTWHGPFSRVSAPIAALPIACPACASHALAQRAALLPPPPPRHSTSLISYACPPAAAFCCFSAAASADRTAAFRLRTACGSAH